MIKNYDKNKFYGKVVIEFAPISERYWNKNDVVTIQNGQIRLGGCWFELDERYILIEIKK